MELGSAIAGTKLAWEALHLALAARDASKIAEATQELRMKLYAMSDIAMAYIEKNAALVSENAALKLDAAERNRVHADLEAKLRERDNYALHEIRPGTFVYASQPAVQGHQAQTHYLCQPCYDKGVKSIFRYSPPSTHWSAKFTCPAEYAHNISLPSMT